MNPPYAVILAVIALVVVMFIFVAIWASRFVKVGPNQVLVVSGRKVQLPDGRFVGYRMVKGGGTFVLPVIERTDVLSLEVITVEMPGSKAQTAGGHAVQADCVAQVKINSDDVSLLAATERFLSKSQPETANIVRPILEKHLSSVLASSSLEAASQNPAACAALVQAAAASDLARMGLSMLGFTMRNARAA
jgi:flotillin